MIEIVYIKHTNIIKQFKIRKLSLETQKVPDILVRVFETMTGLPEKKNRDTKIGIQVFWHLGLHLGHWTKAPKMVPRVSDILAASWSRDVLVRTLVNLVKPRTNTSNNIARRFHILFCALSPRP